RPEDVYGLVITMKHILVIPLLACCTGLCGESASAPALHEEWTSVAGVSGLDRITHIHIVNLLARKNIHAMLEGSIGYGVNVPKTKAVQAIMLLKADARRKEYFVTFSDGTKVTPDMTTAKDYPINQLYADTLKTRVPSLPTELMAVLRDPQVGKLAKKAPLVVRFHVRPRSYMLPKNKTATGYEGQIEMGNRVHTAGAEYQFQVWEGGKQIAWSGG